MSRREGKVGERGRNEEEEVKCRRGKGGKIIKKKLKKKWKIEESKRSKKEDEIKKEK